MDDKDFYDKAFEYFTYHAEQRTTMINFYIAVFGACIALYGSLIMDAPIACVLISVFLLIVSILFYHIDIRNKLDVKQSQSVLCAFEDKYKVTSSKDHAAFGVFSNEENLFILYDSKFRKEDEQYKKLLKKAKKLSSAELDKEIDKFIETHQNLNAHDVKASLSHRFVPHLSSCIKFLYFICTGISIIGLAAAIFLCCV